MPCVLSNSTEVQCYIVVVCSNDWEHILFRYLFGDLNIAKNDIFGSKLSELMATIFLGHKG